MRRRAVIMCFALLGVAAHASSLWDTPAVAQSESRSTNEIASMLRVYSRTEQAASTERELWPGYMPAPPTSARQALERFNAAAPTLESCTDLARDIEAWSAWAESQWLWQFSLVGMPESQMAHAARVAALAILTLSDAAARGLEQAIQAADHQPALRRDEHIERQLTNALHVHEIVLPLRAARAGVVLASLTNVASLRTALARAAGGLAGRTRDVSPWAEVERDLVAGHAAAMLGATADAIALFTRIERSGALSELPSEYAADVRLEIMLAGALARSDEIAPDLVLRELLGGLTREPAKTWLASSFHRSLLAADASMRLARRHAATSVGQAHQDHSLSLALGRYEHALGAKDPVLSREAVRVRVLDHLGAVLHSRESYQDLPPIAGVAAARGMASDVSVRERAIAVLEATASRPQSELGLLAPTVMFDLATAYARSDEPSLLGRAADSYLLFADRYASDERSGAAIALACSVADRLLRIDEDSAIGLGERIKIALSTMRRAHTSPLQVPQRDAWRIALARLLVWQVDSGLVEPGKAEAIAREVSAVTASVQDASLMLPAAIERAAAWSAVIDSRGLELDSTRDAGARLMSAAEDARTELAAMSEDDVSVAARIIMYHGKSLLALGRAAEALEAVARLGANASETDIEPRTIADALLVELEALIRLASPMDRAFEVAERLESIRSGAASALIDRHTTPIWNELQPRIRGFISAENGDVSLTPSQMLAFALADRLSGLAQIGGSGEAAARRVAWTLLLSGRFHDADRSFADLVSARPAVLEYRRGRAEALLAQGADQEAFAAYREIVARTDSDASPDVWRAWTRMLEILSRNNPDGCRTPEILREIARLRTLESALDQPECLARLKAIQDALEKP